MFSTSLHIVERSANRLVVVCPPYYWIGAIFLAVGLFVAYAALSAGDSNVKPQQNIKWLGIAVAAPFLLGGIGILTYRTRIVLERDNQSMRVEARAFGIQIRANLIPLVQIQQAIVETNVQRGQALSVRLQGGRLVRVAGASTQQGYGEAASAINQFLGRRD